MAAISSDSLFKTYGSGVFQRSRITALTDFTLQVESGQIFSLLGPNGAGKTTFIKILLSLCLPSAGSALLLGRPLSDSRVKSKIGYLPENHRYPGYLTGEQVLRFFGQLSGVKTPDLRQRIPALLELVGISRWKGVKVKKFSKGMLQRLGLAQAMINDPELLFLDEPTDGVDPLGRKEIRDILNDQKRQGKTIFLNSHLLSEVELISDRVAILDKGKLLKVGTVEDLTSPTPLYQIGINGSVPEDVIQEAAAMAMKPAIGELSLSVELKTAADLNRMIDLLRRHEVEITSIARQRSTLEESFIHLIKREVAP